MLGRLLTGMLRTVKQVIASISVVQMGLNASPSHSHESEVSNGCSDEILSSVCARFRTDVLRMYSKMKQMYAETNLLRCTIVLVES